MRLEELSANRVHHCHTDVQLRPPPKHDKSIYTFPKQTLFSLRCHTEPSKVGETHDGCRVSFWWGRESDLNILYEGKLKVRDV